MDVEVMYKEDSIMWSAQPGKKVNVIPKPVKITGEHQVIFTATTFQ